MRERFEKEQEEKKIIRLSALVPEPYHRALFFLRREEKTHFWLRGGRGSGKSSFASLGLWLCLLSHPECHGAAFRKVGENLRQSVLSQLLWAADQLSIGHLVQVNLSVMELVFLPTGQKILLRGVDDPRKLKSIKPPFGRFGALWFEEADEFENKAQLDHLLQSFLRGAGYSAVFYSFNPPADSSHWIYAAAAEGRADTCLAEGCYTLLPENWLGERFLAEAEQLKRTNPTRYAHEYLGKPKETEGAVFGNLRLRKITDAEYACLDRRYHGLDFGYGADPLHYVCCAPMGRRKLYILDEFRGYRVSLERTAEEILRRNKEGDRVVCDSAEPRSIAQLRQFGVRAVAAKKGRGSLEHGMRFLCDCIEEIVVDPEKCPETARELQKYTLQKDKSGRFLGGWPDRDNHAIDALRYALEEVSSPGVGALYAGI